MLYKATVGFSGKVTARKGQVLNLKDKDVIKDLTKAGYIVKANAEEVAADENVGNDN